MRPGRAARLVAGAAILTLASACGGGGDDDKAAPPRSTLFGAPVESKTRAITEGTAACAILTRAEVEGAVGVAVNPGAGVVGENGDSSCRWSLRSDSEQFVGILFAASGASDPEVLKLTARGETLNGVWDKAFTSIDTAYAFRGTKMVVVTVVTSRPVATRKDLAVRLLQTATSRA